MKKLLTLALAASLSACAGTPHLDVCKGAELRRTAYSTAIEAVAVLEFSGRPVPQAALIARDAAQLALSILDRNCPRAAPTVTPAAPR
ncbi:hypothetical protein [Sphingomonas sp. PP-CC-3A-396]|uniref:hypothetical protein n=1 Tax=Sphingomonas sp. PP-CC-3A-396 TaxID=2135655 RepID=UPI0010433811|nr:hypothetical protein [Sphingomonas sp. PP-CC-3A-396]TCQ04122.1 hypothetical protein C8J40_109257 [Sphingomonas sp. PP-CC-3A-396]